MSKKSLVITIPVLNEEKTLKRQINLLLDFISINLQAYSVSVVIANNGSVDSTEAIAKELATKNSSIHLVSLNEQGVGLALKTSWAKYPGDFLGYMDLDLATDLSHIRESLSILEDGYADIVNGSRLLKNSRVSKRSLIRTLASKCFNRIIYIAFNSKFTDGMCGFKFYSTKKLDSFFENTFFQSDGWFFATEFLILADMQNFRILEIPINWTDGETTKVKIIRLSLKYLKEILSLKHRLRSLK